MSAHRELLARLDAIDAGTARLRALLTDGERELADAAVALLIRYPDGRSGSEIASELHREKGRVLAALRHDDRFRRTGRGRGSRYSLTFPPEQGARTAANRIGGDAGPNPADEPGQDDTSPQNAAEPQAPEEPAGGVANYRGHTAAGRQEALRASNRSRSSRRRPGTEPEDADEPDGDEPDDDADDGRDDMFQEEDAVLTALADMGLREEAAR